MLKIKAADKVGMDNKKENLAASTLLNFKNLAPVKVIPLREVPGISAKTLYNPIIKESLWEIDLVKNFSYLFLSLKNNRRPKNIVAYPITAIFII